MIMRNLVIIIAALMAFSCGNSQQGGAVAQERAQAAVQIKNFKVEQFKELLKDTSVVLLDVRTPQEFAQGHIEGAMNIDVKDSLFVQNVLAGIPKGAKVAVYCRSGRRSMDAAGKMCAQGYEVVNLQGGILAWEAVGK